ncbi:MAG: hypothetical protein SGJ17_02530, partial [Hyphomicrobiales bacterium]|nr:hypothetical protein [Hyphomicrobiales bacterium]
AEAMHKKALALNEALGRKQGMANNYGNLGQIHKQRGDMPGACANWRKARDFYRQIGARPQIEQVDSWMHEAGCADG